jgi:hypothetical protein
MSEEKTTKKRRSKKDVETVEFVETAAPSAVEEEAIVNTIEDYDKVDDTPIADTADAVEVIEPAVEDTELKKEDTVVEETKADEPIKEEKPKRTRKSKKAESAVTENAGQADTVAEDKPKAKKSNGSDRPADAPIIIEKPIWLYKASIGNQYIKPITGTYYRWRDDVVTGRICITDSPENKGILCKVLGWINESDVK